MNKTSLVNEICIHENSIAHVKFTAQWNNDSGLHTAIKHVEKFNVWRDIDLLPEPLKKDILHQPTGKGDDHQFESGDVVSAWQSTQLYTLPLNMISGEDFSLTYKQGVFILKDG